MLGLLHCLFFIATYHPVYSVARIFCDVYTAGGVGDVGGGYGQCASTRNSRFADDAWDPLMIARLLYDDRRLSLDRPTRMVEPSVGDAYDNAIEFDWRRLVVVGRREGENREPHRPTVSA